MTIKESVRGWLSDKREEWKEDKELDRQLRVQEKIADKEARIIEKKAFSAAKIEKAKTDAISNAKIRAEQGPLGLRILKATGKVTGKVLDNMGKPKSGQAGKVASGSSVDPFAALNAFTAAPAPNSNASGQKKKVRDVNDELKGMI